MCLVSGSNVMTTEGFRPVESLRAGQFLVAADGLTCRIVGRHCRNLAFRAGPHPNKPLVIKRGALGPDLPRQGLYLSPQQRVVFSNAGQIVLGPARALDVLPAIRRQLGCRQTSYHTLYLDRRAILNVEGLAMNATRAKSGEFAPRLQDDHFAPEMFFDASLTCKQTRILITEGRRPCDFRSLECKPEYPSVRRSNA